MKSFIKSRGARIRNNITTVAQTSAGIPEIVIPNKETDISSASAIYAAFTLTSTTATLTSSTEGALSSSGCTVREFYNVKPIMANAVFFAATARRKPGTTASIAAQEITITVNSVEVGRFSVAGASTGEDPEAGYVCCYSSVGDSRFALSVPHPITIAGTVDPGLEIVVWIVGNQD